MSKLEKIVLGTVQFGLEYGINNSIGIPSEHEIERILDLAYNNNIRTLDTAEAYGNSHQVISNYHRKSKNRFKIISKYKRNIENLPDELLARVKRHIKEFDVERLEAYLFHDFDEFLELVSLKEREILSLKESKLVNKIGVSVYTNEQLLKLLEYSFIDIVQVPFNLIDNHYIRSESLNKAKRNGLEIHTRSVFLQGLFFKEKSMLSNYFNPIKPYLNLLDNHCKQYNIDIEDLALNYPLSKDYIDKVLIGVDSEKQLLSNIHSLKNTTHNQFKMIDNIKIEDQSLLNPSNWKK